MIFSYQKSPWRWGLLPCLVILPAALLARPAPNTKIGIKTPAQRPAATAGESDTAVQRGTELTKVKKSHAAPSSKFYLQVEASAQGAYWDPGLKTEGIEPIKYETEGLSTYKAHAAIGFGGPVFSFSYEVPFIQSARQKEMFMANKTHSTGIEKYAAGIDFRPLLSYLFPPIDDHYLIKTLLSMRINHSEALYFGNAKVPSTFFYLPLDAVIDWNALTVQGGIKVDTGSSVAFRTKFTDSEITACLGEGKGVSVHIGYYELDWRRPSDNNYKYTINGFPIIYETSYRSKGAALLIKNDDPASPGLNGDFNLRIGAMWIHDRIKDTNPQEKEGYHPTRSFFALKTGLWYNWYLAGGKTMRGLFFGLGSEFDGRHWSIDDKATNNNSSTTQGSGGSGDWEKFFRVFLKTGYKF